MYLLALCAIMDTERDTSLALQGRRQLEFFHTYHLKYKYIYKIYLVL